MNARTFSWLCPIILGASGAAQISVSVPTDPEQRGQIESVEAIRASQLDKNLPDVILEDWLLAEAGPDAKIGWSYTPPYMGLCWNNTRYPHCACGAVDVGAKTWDGREFSVQIAIGGACGSPVFDTGMVSGGKKEGATFMRSLSDLPRLRWANPKK